MSMIIGYIVAIIAVLRFENRFKKWSHRKLVELGACDCGHWEYEHVEMIIERADGTFGTKHGCMGDIINGTHKPCECAGFRDPIPEAKLLH